MANSSSGQQETLPLILILETISQHDASTDGISLYVEEPEAHIFPTTQKDIVELISLVFNERKNNSQFFITTHSPYILTSFNNLLQAGMLAIDADEEKIKKIDKLVSKSRFLKPEEVAVYSVESGDCQSIMDKETGLIDANMIDEVSNDLGVQFDELLDLEE
ncbi:MAG: AAA family ATPase [Cyanobacteria bacterium J06631_6]